MADTDTAPTDEPTEIQGALADLLVLSHEDLTGLEQQLVRLRSNPGRVRIDRTRIEKVIKLIGAMKRSKAPTREEQAA